MIIRITILSFFLIAPFKGSSQNGNQKWYKGNLHTHSYWSDGDEFPEMIMDWYKTNKYDFIALSDHNILADGEKWVKISKSKMYEDGFNSYLKKFGDKWVTYKLDSGRTHVRLKTYEEYRKLFEDNNFLILKSEEITDRFEGKPIHMNATNLRALISPQGGKSVSDVIQRNIDAVLQQRNETGVPMFPHINHPNFYYGISAEDIINVHGERFFEVYNGHPSVHNYGDSLHPGIEAMWDKINIAYLKKNQPLMYGLATDDSHNYHQFGGAYANAGRGWVMVYTDSLSASSLVKAMESGNFYASTGVILEDLSVKNHVITVKIKKEPDINYKIEFVGVRKNEDTTKVVKTVNGTVASMKISSDFGFVRIRITSNKIKPNPFQQGDFEMAWTQPVR